MGYMDPRGLAGKDRAWRGFLPMARAVLKAA
jgi:hypothetical protein